ncbi:exported hypothetical protein [Cupriavidus taiwanensis]|nr:exported hypothetical protein [Cupriavidus taiwanensis]SOY91382.1 exported hypothetical protein [Cupriavidus taiwanensis]
MWRGLELWSEITISTHPKGCLLCAGTPLASTLWAHPALTPTLSRKRERESTLGKYQALQRSPALWVCSPLPLAGEGQGVRAGVCRSLRSPACYVRIRPTLSSVFGINYATAASWG